MLVVDRDYGFEFALEGELVKLIFGKLPVERNHDTDTARNREIGLGPFNGVPTYETDIPVVEAEIHKRRAQRIHVLLNLLKSDFLERFFGIVFLHEKSMVAVFARTVIKHVLEVSDRMLVAEHVAFVLGRLELVNHRLNDFTFAPFDISVHCIRIIIAHARFSTFILYLN